VNGNGEKAPMFSTQISLGSILTIISMLASVSLAYGALTGRILVLEQEMMQHTGQMNAIEGKVDTLTIKVTDLAYEEGKQAQKLEDERHEKP
jgi:DNA repair ATPase RecN